MSQFIYEYRVWCETESIWKTYTTKILGDIKCPDNKEHVVDSTKAVLINKINDEPRDPSGKLRVQPTSRKIGTMTCWIGCGDNPANPLDVGNGQDFILQHNIGDPTSQNIYLDFNCVMNETWLHQGYLTWSNTKFDHVTLQMVTRATGLIPGTNTNYTLYGGYLVIPAYGQGNYNIPAITNNSMNHDMGLIFMPTDENGMQPQSFWDAEWDNINKRYINITPAPMGNGHYNMFALELPLSKFVNKVHLLDNGFQCLSSDDATQLGHGMRMKLTCTTSGADHNWSIACILTLHRKKTL